MNDKEYIKYITSKGLYNFRDKQKSIIDNMIYMFIRTQRMFKWSGLPETIPADFLEQYIQIFGVCCITEVNGDLYAFYGGMGGEPDVYYQPTIFTIANPALNFSGELKIGTECEIIKNDPFYKGLTDLNRKYSSQLAENELSLNMASINTRVQQLLLVRDDTAKEAADKYMKDVIDGKLESLNDRSFFDDNTTTLPMTSSGSTNVLGDLIEYEQYIKASWFNELGLNANYNMKREALNSAESSINDDILFPLVDEMLEERQKGCERVNALYGTDISVELASSWEDNKEEEEAEIEAINPDDDDRKEDPEDDDKKEDAEDVKDGEENE